MHWLKDGDINSIFFHYFATTKKKMNTISSITNDNGNLFTSHEQIRNVASNYFENLYCNNVVDLALVINKISPCISYDHNLMLLTPFTLSEFKKKIFFRWISINH